MRKFLVIIMTTTFVSGCANTGGKLPEKKDMGTLAIRWERLVNEKGQTCERCGSTENELQEAVGSLRKALGALGIEVVLEKKPLSPTACAKDISQSNRIWIGDRSLEEWLGAAVGKSPCGFCCADLGQSVECRTITVGGKTYETIPAELVIKAGLLAGSQMVAPPSGRVCCPGSATTQETNSTCCPKPSRRK